MSDYSDSTYSSYDTSYTTTYTEPTYDTSWSTGSYDTAVYDTAYDTGWSVDSSYSYDSTDWSTVADVSQGYSDLYSTYDDAGWELYNASTDAWLVGDSWAAYNLNQSSLDAFATADTAWDTSNDVWTSMAETTTVTSWDTGTAYDTSYDAGYTSSYDTSSTSSYDTSSYDTSSDW